MERIFQSHLFEKGYLVADRKRPADPNTVGETIYALARLFAVDITSGYKLAHPDMIELVSEELGIGVPKPFYRGFPDSVRNLSRDQLLYDQMIHYLLGYGLDLLDGAGYSVFEDFLKRDAFNEGVDMRPVAILSEDEAEAKLKEMVGNLLLSSRPLNDHQFGLVSEYMRTYGCDFQRCASKTTAVRLLIKLRDMRLVKFVGMPDVLKLADELNADANYGATIKHLNLRNRDRVLITNVMDEFFRRGEDDLTVCCEKKADWCGLLHHIHYQPKTERAQYFVNIMRGKVNLSAYSHFETAMRLGNTKAATDILLATKGQSALLRNLNYIVSRCETLDDVKYVCGKIGSKNVIVLLQMLMQYDGYAGNGQPRNFMFTKYNRLKVHAETRDEVARRKSALSKDVTMFLNSYMRLCLGELLMGKLGTVYVDPAMEKMALPMKESASQGGLGVLAGGSRIPFEEGKKIRAFTYWEKVDDIDLSVIGMTEDGNQEEFSWRTMWNSQSKAITYSGDQTRGFRGGSEYFDIDTDAFREEHPNVRYLVFCDNVFSGKLFSECVCRAGFMMRDKNDSGEVYEPKTVKSSFTVNCESRFAYLFGIDLEKNEFVWLNVARNSDENVAGCSSLSFLMPLFRATDVINMADFFKMAAAKLTDDPEEADVIVSDAAFAEELAEKQIRSCDFDKMYALYDSLSSQAKKGTGA